MAYGLKACSCNPLREKKRTEKVSTPKKERNVVKLENSLSEKAWLNHGQPWLNQVQVQVQVYLFPSLYTKCKNSQVKYKWVIYEIRSIYKMWMPLETQSVWLMAPRSCRI